MTSDKRFLRGVYLVSFVILLLLCIIPFTVVAVDAQGTIRSASEFDYPPFSVANEDGTAGGFSVELLKAALSAVDKNVSFYIDSWSTIKEQLTVGQIDVLPLVGRTPERENIYDFSVPYISMYGAIFVRSGDTRITSLEDLKDKQVLVLKADSAEEFVRRSNVSNNIITTTSLEEAFKLLSSGKYDALITQEITGNQLIRHLNIDNVVSIAKIEKFRQDFCFAVKEGDDELLLSLNDGLSKVIISGKFQEIYDVWIGDILMDKADNDLIQKTSNSFEPVKFSVEQKSLDVAKQIEIYLISHPLMTVADLQNDSYFQTIAVQPVGKKGYTTIMNSVTLVNYFHKSTAFIGTDYHSYEQSRPSFYKILNKAQNCADSGGIYDWIEPDNSTNLKYAFYTCVKVPTADGVILRVGATTYLDDYYLAPTDFNQLLETENVSQSVNKLATSNEDILLLKNNFHFWVKELNDRFDLSAKIPPSDLYTKDLITNSKLEKIEDFDKQFGIIDGAWRTNVSYFNELLSTEDVTGVMLYSNFVLTPEIKQMMLAFQNNVKVYADATRTFFANRYFTLENGIDVMYPKEWIFESGHNDSFNSDIWYYVADPTHNPSRQSVWTPVYYDLVWDKWMVSLITPIYVDNTFIGTTGGDVMIQDIFYDVSDKKFNEKGYALIFDSDKNILVHPEYLDEIEKKGSMGELFTFTDIKEKELSELIQNIDDTEGEINYVENGIEYVFLYQKLDSIDWYYGFVIESSMLYTESSLDKTNLKINSLHGVDFNFIYLILFMILIYLYLLIVPKIYEDNSLKFQHNIFLYLGMFTVITAFCLRYFDSTSIAIYLERAFHTLCLWYFVFFVLLCMYLAGKKIASLKLQIFLAFNVIVSLLILFTELFIKKIPLVTEGATIVDYHAYWYILLLALEAIYILISVIALLINKDDTHRKITYTMIVIFMILLILNILLYQVIGYMHVLFLLATMLIMGIAIAFILMKRGVLKQDKNILLLIMGLAFIVLIIVLIINTIATKDSIEQHLINQKLDHMTSLADAKELEVHNYFINMMQQLKLVSTQSDLTTEELMELTRIQSDFDELFILDSNGIIIIATNSSRIGTNQSNNTYFINGQMGQYIKKPYHSKFSNENSLAISMPFHENVLVARVSLYKMNYLVANKAGLDSTGEILLAFKDNNNNNNNNTIIFTDLLFKNYSNIITAEQGNIPSVQAVNRVEERFIGVRDYRGVPVLAISRYEPLSGIGIVVKEDQSEVLSYAKNISNSIERFTFGVIISILVMGIFFIFLFTKSLRAEIKEKTSELQVNIVDLNNTKKAMMNMLEDMKIANENLKEVDKAKSEFLNIVSHELKTPLTAMIAHLDVLDGLKRDLNKQELLSFEAVRRNADQLKILISNILEVSRIESGKFELAIISVDVNYLIKEAVNSLEILAKQKDIHFKTHLGDIPLIQADDSRLKEVLNNLLTNAIKFTDKGIITIQSKKIDKFIEVQVTDTGVGIPPDKIKNLFQKFYQVDASISRRYGGTGLGLSITKKIVESHGGVVSVSSVFGKGTTFKFTLPIKNVSQTKTGNKSNSVPDPFAKFDDRIKQLGKENMQKSEKKKSVKNNTNKIKKVKNIKTNKRIRKI